MKLVLIRHGRPDENDVARQQDPPLNANGRNQAEAVGRLLAAEGIARIVSSPLRRAYETAEPLARRTGLPIDVIEGWAEADKKMAIYRSTETLRAQGGKEWAQFLADPIRYLGADPEEFTRTVIQSLETLAKEMAPKAKVAVFTHGLPINVILSHVLRLDGIIHFLPAYGSVTRLRLLQNGRFGIICINETAHHTVEAAALSDT